MEEWLKPNNLIARFLMQPGLDQGIAYGIEIHNWPTEELQNIWTALLECRHLGKRLAPKTLIELIEDKPTRLLLIQIYRNWEFIATTVNLDWQVEGALGLCRN